MPLDDIARLCVGSLFLMTLCTYLITKYRVIERLISNRFIKILFILGNIALSLVSLILLVKNFYLGIIAAYFSALLWVIQFHERHSIWLRPIALNALIIFAALSVLFWFDALPVWKKFMILLKYTEPSLLSKIKYFLPR